MAPNSETIDVLRTSTLFSGLDDDVLNELAKVVRPVRVAKGKTLFLQGDAVNGCYAVLDGTLKVSLFGENKQETFLAVVGKGDVVGEMGLIDRNPRSATVSALKTCRLGHIRMHDFDRLADANTEIYRHMLKVMAARLRTTNKAYSVQQLPLSGRLAHIFIRLVDGFGETLPDQRILIRQRFSQADLGRMTGAARENVNRQLSRWRGDNILSRVGGYYCIETMDGLRALAKPDGD